MKAIILISSIFYILGLKISNKIDLIKKHAPAEKTITQTIQPKEDKPDKKCKQIEIEVKEEIKEKQVKECHECA